MRRRYKAMLDAWERAIVTKKWSATASGDGKTKRQAMKDERAAASRDIHKWLKDQGAVESVTFDEETGQPTRTFSIDLRAK